MIIDEKNIATKEVMSWKGIHLLHFQMSSCSLKVRVLLMELGLKWKSHPISLPSNQNSTPWFLGINPRGVVPVLVHDGVVHVESNDILVYLDRRFSSSNNRYFIHEKNRFYDEANELLRYEDSLHTELRLLTMNFGPLALKSDKKISDYEANGKLDSHRKKEINWWRAKAEKGITKEEVRKACESFQTAFSMLDDRLETRDWLIGTSISIVDIAWFTNIQRLEMLGYPMKRHPNLHHYYKEMIKRNSFKTEKKMPMSRLGTIVFTLVRSVRRLKGESIKRYLAV